MSLCVWLNCTNFPPDVLQWIYLAVFQSQHLFILNIFDVFKGQNEISKGILKDKIVHANGANWGEKKVYPRFPSSCV